MICSACQEDLGRVRPLFIILRYLAYKKAISENIDMDNVFNYTRPVDFSLMQEDISEVFKTLGITKICCKNLLSSVMEEPVMDSINREMFARSAPKNMAV